MSLHCIPLSLFLSLVNYVLITESTVNAATLTTVDLVQEVILIRTEADQEAEGPPNREALGTGNYIVVGLMCEWR